MVYCHLHSLGTVLYCIPSHHVDTGDDDVGVDHQMDAVFSRLPEDGGSAGTAVQGAWHQGVEPMGGWCACSEAACVGG